MSYEIREASELDLPQVLSLYAQPAFDNERVLSQSDALEMFNTFKCYPFYKLFVLIETDQGKILASYAFLKMNNLGHLGSPSAVIEDVVVAPQYQGQGLGKRMMQHAMQLAKSLDCYKLVLSSNVKRVNAHAFYEALGFEQHGISFKVESAISSRTKP
jgi:ribosomal protein S18 acetylase RimI-like enzyme